MKVVAVLLAVSGCSLVFPLDIDPPTDAPTPYRDTILADSPIAYWRLGEQSGLAAADEIGEHDGVFVGDPTLGEAGALAIEADTAVAFGGARDAVSVVDAPALRLNGSWSIEMWVKMVSSAAAFPAIIGKGDAQLGSGWVIYINDDSQPVFKRAGMDGMFTDSIVPMDRFSYFVVTYDGTTLQWYVDGASRRSHQRILLDSIDPGSLILAAESSATTNNSNVALDEVALYATALTPDRIQAHFLAAE